MKARRFMLMSVWIVALALLTACQPIVPIVPVVAPESASTGKQIEPQAAQWDTWILTSKEEVRPESPPDVAATADEIAELKALAAARDADAEALVAYWSAGSPSYRWISLALAQHAEARIGPGPLFSRGMALLNVAVYDATVAAWDAKYTYNRPRPSQADATLSTWFDPPDSPSYPNEHAVAAGAASTILTHLFPDNAALFAEMAEEAVHAQLVAGVAYPSDVEAGLALGRAVAEQVIAHGETDGSDAVWDGVIPTDPGNWVGENPVLPMAGSWHTWVLSSGSQLRPDPPPAYDSEQMQVELTALKTFTQTFATSSAAFFWQSPRGAMPYIYGNTARLLFENHLDENPPQAALVYAALSVAQHDAFIACYDAKYTYWSIRPSQLDSEITPLFANPNFPSYPSAHGCGSGAVATVLSSFFPADADSLMGNAKEAGDSRLWGYIHFQSDVDVGLAMGQAVGNLVSERVQEMTQP